MSRNAFRHANVFAAPMALRDKAGLRVGRIDHEAVARAEAALTALSSKYGDWLQEEVERLDDAREAVRLEGVNQGTVNKLFTHAHDLKGLGATYGFPIIGRISASLCNLIGGGDGCDSISVPLVDAHINAIKAAVRDNIRDADTSIGAALAGELERHTAEYLRHAEPRTSAPLNNSLGIAG